MKTPAERGPDGLWLYETRKARGFSNAAKARAAVEKATGVHIAPSVYTQYEGGSRPISPKHRVALVQFWGEPPSQPADSPTSGQDVAALVASIGQLVDALARSEASRSASSSSSRRAFVSPVIDPYLERRLRWALLVRSGYLPRP